MLKSDKIKTLATIIAAFTIGFLVGIFLQPSIVTLLNLENVGVTISSVEKIDNNTASVQKKPSPLSSIPTLTPIITNTPNITSPSYDKTPTYSVLPILFVPKDLQADYSLLNSIDMTMQEVQSWYSSQLGGRTFKVNPSIVVVGNHELKWYCPKTTRANQCVQVPGVLGADAGDSGNVLKDLNSQGYMVKEGRILMIFWVGSYGFAQGGGGFAVVGDWTIDGIAGKYEKGIYSSGCQDSANSAVFCRKNATVGTVAHELGHAFGLPHPNLNDTNWCLSVMGCGWDFPANQLLNTSINPETSVLLSNPFFQVKVEPE